MEAFDFDDKRLDEDNLTPERTPVSPPKLAKLFSLAPVSPGSPTATELSATIERRTSNLYKFPEIQANEADGGWAGQPNTAL